MYFDVNGVNLTKLNGKRKKICRRSTTCEAMICLFWGASISMILFGFWPNLPWRPQKTHDEGGREKSLLLAL